MINEIELNFIEKIISDTSLYHKTKLMKDNLEDPLCRTLFSEIGKSLKSYGDFIPNEHLKAMCEDKDRMEHYNKLKYPLKINSPKDILDYVDKYKNELKFETLEKTIVEKFNKRKMSSIASMISEDLEDSKKSVKNIMRKYSYEIDKLMYKLDDDLDFKSTEDLIQEEMTYQNSSEVDEYIPTGFSIIDDLYGGIEKATTNYLLAPNKVGKSMFLYQATLNSLKKDRNVLFITIEIPQKDARKKILANYSYLKYHEIKNKSLSEEDRNEYFKSMERFNQDYKDSFYIMYNAGGVCCKDIEAHVNDLKKIGIIIDDICIDYLGIMQSNDGKIMTEVEKNTVLPKEVRMLAHKTDTRVFIPQQLHTSAKNKAIEDINEADIYYAKSIGMEATTLLVMMRDNTKNGDLVLKMLPSRGGWNESIYHFPNKDLDRCYLGKDEVYEDIEF